MADTDEFWTAEEVSGYLRIPQSTIYKLAQDKVLPGFKVGKHWRFRREAILKWIDDSENKNVHQHQATQINNPL
ncbi:helix-turn-helix domain-containing protein [Flexilinea flocculi]|uniref:Transcriptional regulator, AlpA family n=1 Tax=Flexilinea flocculi TaxID=1678840 RepID=A0A0S7BR30_9CHLR|nr:helix-turn-helix domain-containing protein [Flexilinea flocculi]GAP40939.1 transcriptional regulator, AlpA family [Flexilinea flocculi]